MSICLAQNTLSPFKEAVWFSCCLLITVVLATIIGAYRPRSVIGRQRLANDQPLWTVAVSGIVAASVWLGLQIVIVGNRAAQLMQARPGEQLDLEKQLTAFDFALWATIPFFIGFALMLVLDRILHRRLLASLGFVRQNLGRGLAIGALGAFIVTPLIICFGLVLQRVYHAFDYEPPAHQLLAAMKNAEPLLRAALIFGAVIAAPFFEEYLFRGHIQTFLVGVFTMWTRSRNAGAPPPLPIQFDQATSEFAPPRESLPAPALSYQTPFPAMIKHQYRSSTPIWMAILLTSFLFAIIHPLWTAPLIFVLAVCLGYAYERTGNLWAPIVIHALFNTINTIEFLYLT